jgi:hypothetical protein
MASKTVNWIPFPTLPFRVEEVQFRKNHIILVFELILVSNTANVIIEIHAYTTATARSGSQKEKKHFPDLLHTRSLPGHARTIHHFLHSISRHLSFFPISLQPRSSALLFRSIQL